MIAGKLSEKVSADSRLLLAIFCFTFAILLMSLIYGVRYESDMLLIYGKLKESIVS